MGYRLGHRVSEFTLEDFVGCRTAKRVSLCTDPEARVDFIIETISAKYIIQKTHFFSVEVHLRASDCKILRLGLDPYWGWRFFSACFGGNGSLFFVSDFIKSVAGIVEVA